MALECKITKKLGNFTLDVDIRAGTGVTALMGASGSGKSMALRCIAGVSKPDNGRITLDGNSLFDFEQKINLPPQKRKVGFLFQDYALFPNMTVLQNIMCGANRDDKKKRKSIAEDLAETFHITAHLGKYPHQLSGGEKQRAAIARILAGTPDILMLDEPFSALDSHLRWELENELASAFQRFGKTVLYVSHNRDEAYRLCDNIIIINNGRSEVSGGKWELFKNPVTVQAARLTGCKNIAPCKAQGTKITVPGWGAEFEANGKTAEFVGIRANYLTPACLADKDRVAAAFEFEIVREIEDTFTNILYVRKKGADLPAILRWEMPKKNREALRDMPQEVAFLRENLMFLRKGGMTMRKIAVFTDKASEICDFFDASRFLIYEKKADKWEVTGKPEFEKIVPSAPAQTRKMTGGLLPLIDGCDVIAGGLLVGIPYSVFDMAGFHIFQIDSVNDVIFDEMVKDIQNAAAQRNLKERVITETRPVETATPGVFSLDLIALQSDYPEVSSKKAMADFLENTPFMELHLICKHIPPWIENSGKYDIKAQNIDGAVSAVITRKC